MRQKVSLDEIAIPRIKILELDTFLVSKVNNIQNLDFKHFPFYEKYEAIINKLPDDKSRESMQLGKLISAAGYQDKIFIYIGVTLEALLNNVAEMYISNNWVRFNNLDYKKTIIDKPLGDKINCIDGLNLFNNSEANDIIKGKALTIRPLRNYAGHAKKGSFIDVLFETESNILQEVDSSLNLIETILTATEYLKNNPPATYV